jgi:hypothetical protein
VTRLLAARRSTWAILHEHVAHRPHLLRIPSRFRVDLSVVHSEFLEHDAVESPGVRAIGTARTPDLSSLFEAADRGGCGRNSLGRPTLQRASGLGICSWG